MNPCSTANRQLSAAGQSFAMGEAEAVQKRGGVRRLTRLFGIVRVPVRHETGGGRPLAPEPGTKRHHGQFSTPGPLRRGQVQIMASRGNRVKSSVWTITPSSVSNKTP